MKSSLRSLLFSVVLVAACGTSSRAGVVSHIFSGTVDGTVVTGTGTLPFGVGATATGSFFYDDSTVFTDYSGTLARYQSAQTGVNFLINGLYSYNHSQASPAFSIADAANNEVEFGPTASNPPELFTVLTGSHDFLADGLHAVGAFFQYEGDPGLLSSPDVLAGLSIDSSRLLLGPSFYSSAKYQEFVSGPSGLTELVVFNVRVETVDGEPLEIAAGTVPEPSSIAVWLLVVATPLVRCLSRRVNSSTATDEPH
jgi:hypothetical protein